MGGPCSGGANRTFRSIARRARRGNSSTLAPVVRRRVTGSGAGQTMGQYAVEIATRIRCPAFHE